MNSLSIFLAHIATDIIFSKMITQEEVIEIGKTLKPHGIKGEISVSINNDNINEKTAPYYILNIDNILVPFFIKSIRFKSSETALVQFDGIDTEELARELGGNTVYLHKKFTSGFVDEEDEGGITEFIGYTIIDENKNVIGEIIDIDDNTENVLFIVAANNDELYIPATDDFILEINDNTQTIQMQLPKGLVNMDEAEDEEN